MKLNLGGGIRKPIVTSLLSEVDILDGSFGRIAWKQRFKSMWFIERVLQENCRNREKQNREGRAAEQERLCPQVKLTCTGKGPSN